VIDMVIAYTDYTESTRRDTLRTLTMSLDTLNSLMVTVRLRTSPVMQPVWPALLSSSARLGEAVE